MLSTYIAMSVFLIIVIVSALMLNFFQKEDKPKVEELKEEIAKMKADNKKRLETDCIRIDMLSKLSKISAEQNRTIEDQKAEIMSLRKDLAESNALVLHYQYGLLKKDEPSNMAKG